MMPFVIRLKPDGSGPTYSSYLGANSDDRGSSIAIDSSGNAYVVGFTNSGLTYKLNLFPQLLVPTLKTYLLKTGAFLSKISADW